MLPFKKRLLIYGGVGLALFLILAVSTLALSRKIGKAREAKLPDVIIPSIVNGELILPKIATASAPISLEKAITPARVMVVSANLVGVFDQQKLTGVRVIGELGNTGERFVTAVSPVVRFFDVDGKVVGQKIGRLSGGFDLNEVPPGEKTLYDVTVDDPPRSDKLEIFFNPVASSESAALDQLKIASRSMEVKTASSDSGGQTGSDSAEVQIQQPVDYYIVTGKVVNTFQNPISDIKIYAWAKNEEGKVFALGRTDFKNDLVSPGDNIDFKTMLLPIQSGQTLATYEVAAWGREYLLPFVPR
jgi:hypothetical protein